MVGIWIELLVAVSVPGQIKMKVLVWLVRRQQEQGLHPASYCLLTPPSYLLTSLLVQQTWVQPGPES